MSLPPSAEQWMDRAEIDYIGPFVKAWAAFNAWYRHDSGEAQERAMLEFVKNKPNAARRHVLPLLEGDNDTADALTLKQAVCDLHRSLDAIHLEVARKNVRERISLRSVCIQERPLQHERLARRNFEYKAARVQGGVIEITVTSLRTGSVRFSHRQQPYDANEVYALPGIVVGLSETQRTALRGFYDSCNPRPMYDLLQGKGPELVIAAITFHCQPEELFSGLIETIYSMRNALLHGGVEPDQRILDCYEPAYRIVMQFLADVCRAPWKGAVS